MARIYQLYSSNHQNIFNLMKSDNNFNVITRTSILLTVLMCLSFSSFSQIDDILCENIESSFTGDAVTTLCEQYGNLSHPIYLGEGTSFTSSSQIGSILYGETVHIQGDFLVNNIFKFQNCIIKIDPNVTIFVTPPSSSTSILFVIDNSKLFSCNDLWNGISLSSNTFIHTRNGTKIEDAVSAIKAHDVQNGILFIENTTFNRNEVGILLSQTSSVSNPAAIYRFNKNTFSCTAPLNGTTDKISLAGVHAVNYQILTLNTTNGFLNTNYFENIDYGILTQDSPISLSGKSLFFLKCRKAGISMSDGFLTLSYATFKNCDRIGIEAIKTQGLSLNHCRFRYDDELSDPGVYFNFRDGVRVNSFGLKSKCLIQNCFFMTEFTDQHKNVRGLYFQGGNVGGNTEITIKENTWDFAGRASRGIEIQGMFPIDSKVDIDNNIFEIQSCCGGLTDEIYSPSGIYLSGGNKYNLEIVGNSFFNSVTNISQNFGIQLIGSEGTMNEFSDNHFPPSTTLYSFRPGVMARSFDNITFCNNIFENCHTCFLFNGLNDNVNFTANEAHGSVLIRITGESWIEDQEQRGNAWQVRYTEGFYTYLNQAHCQLENTTYAQYSQFEVHTDQSTAYVGVGFNKYHPKDIDPDESDEWWTKKPGTPNEFCITEQPPPFLSNLKMDISDDLIGSIIENEDIEWQAKRGLYRSLMLYPDSSTSYSSFSSFISAHSNSAIGKLFDVEQAIGNLFSCDSTLKDTIEASQNKYDSLIVELIIIDTILALTTDSSTISSSISLKANIIGEIIDLVSNATQFNDAYRLSINSEIENIRQLNDSIYVLNKWERDEKTFYTIFLNYLEFDTISEIELDTLMHIANKCPVEGGMAVYFARGLLPGCIKDTISDDYTNCFPQISYDTSTVSIARSITTFTDASIEFPKEFKILPNPASDFIEIKLSLENDAKIIIYDNLGKIRYHSEIMLSKVISLEKFEPGFYIAQIQFDSGEIANKILTIIQ